MKKIVSILCLLLVGFLAVAQNSFDPASLLKASAKPRTLVNDYTGNTLTSEQQAALESKLVDLDDSSFTQIAVVIVPTTGGQNATDYATKLGEAWGVGGSKFNNGIVLLIAKDDRQMSIATGYGLEGSLTDATASEIITDVIRPNFRGDDYYRGISEGTDAIISAVRGTYDTPREKSGGGPPVLLIILIIVVIIVMFGNKTGGGGGTFMSRRGSRGIGGPFFFPLGGGGGGFGGGGGGGGGGFGGFGGGGFGGGGASGGW